MLWVEMWSSNCPNGFVMVDDMDQCDLSSVTTTVISSVTTTGISSVTTTGICSVAPVDLPPVSMARNY